MKNEIMKIMKKIIIMWNNENNVEKWKNSKMKIMKEEIMKEIMKMNENGE